MKGRGKRLRLGVAQWLRVSHNFCPSGSQLSLATLWSAFRDQVVLVSLNIALSMVQVAIDYDTKDE